MLEFHHYIIENSEFFGRVQQENCDIALDFLRAVSQKREKPGFSRSIFDFPLNRSSMIRIRIEARL